MAYNRNRIYPKNAPISSCIRNEHEETEDFLKEIIENNPMVDLDEDYLSRQKELKEQWQWEREHNYQIAGTYAGEDQPG